MPTKDPLQIETFEPGLANSVGYVVTDTWSDHINAAVHGEEIVPDTS